MKYFLHIIEIENVKNKTKTKKTFTAPLLVTPPPYPR